MKKYLLLFIFLSLYSFMQVTLGATITSNGTGGGNWSVAATWNGGIAPVSTDDAVIADGDIVTIDAAVTINNLTIGAGTSGILQFEATTARTVTVNGTLTISLNGTFQTAATGTQSSHILNLAGDFINNGTLNFSTNGCLATAQVNFGLGTASTGFANFTCGTTSTTNFRGGALSCYGTWATASTTISRIFPNTTGFIVGQTIASGSGIPVTATITAIVDAHTITISAPTTTVGGYQYFKTAFSAGAGFTGATLNRGIDNTSGLNFTPGGTLTAEGFSSHGFLTITKGLFKILGTNTVSSAIWASGSVTLAQNTGFWLNNPNFTVLAQNGSYAVTGILHVTAGTLNVGYAQGNAITLNGLNVAAGANVTIDGGTINIAGRFYGASTVFYTFNMSSGTINAGTVNQVSASPTATFGLENVTATTGSVVNITGGTINIVHQSAASSGRLDYSVLPNGSLVSVTGGTVNIGTDPVQTFTGTTTSGSTSVINFTSPNGLAIGMPITGVGIPAGTTIVRMVSAGAYAADTLILSQAATASGIDVALSASSYIYTVYGIAQNLVVKNVAPITVIHSGITSIYGDLTINSGSTFADTNNTATVSIGGNWINNGIFIPNGKTGIISFNGTGAQSITNATGETFNNLTINKASGVLTLNNNVLVTGILTLTSGLVNTTSSNLLTLGNAATVGGGATTSFVNGPMAQTWTTVTAAKTFPLGKDLTYRPLIISLTTPTSPLIRAEVFNSAAGGSKGSLNAISTVRYYQTSLISGTAASGGTVKITFGSDDVVTSSSTLVVAQSTTATGTYSSLGNSANDATSVTSVSYNPASGDFLLLGDTGSNLLPVELNSFTASVSKSAINLRWSTSNEVNNSGFGIERSVNKLEWTNISFVNGSGNSNSTKNYSYTDNSISKSGKYYYRLKQTDVGGSFKYSNSTEVDFVTHSVFSLNQNYPNPFNPSTIISYSIPNASNVKLLVYNAIGQVIKVLEDGYKEAGNYNVSFNASELSSGLYFYKIEAGQNSQIRKMMLVK